MAVWSDEGGRSLERTRRSRGFIRGSRRARSLEERGDNEDVQSVDSHDSWAKIGREEAAIHGVKPYPELRSTMSREEGRTTSCSLPRITVDVPYDRFASARTHGIASRGHRRFGHDANRLAMLARTSDQGTLFVSPEAAMIKAITALTLTMIPPLTRCPEDADPSSMLRSSGPYHLFR